jgi:SAM-dependent methyltransferase
MNQPPAVSTNESVPMAATGSDSARKLRGGARMEPIYWVPEQASDLLDVGCNVGEFLDQCRRQYPDMRLAGIDINHSAVAKAQTRLPGVEIHQGFGYELPFPDASFDCVSCIEVIEHVPAAQRPLLVAEMRRVLRPGGRIILRCPHAGIFSWLDAQNFRFRAPALYGTLVGRGNRDAHYQKAEEELVWHHHFTQEELLGVVGSGWKLEACEFGGLLLYPISDILRWPFYRIKRPDHWIARSLEKMAALEYAVNFGKSSYGILTVLRKSTEDEIGR